MEQYIINVIIFFPIPEYDSAEKYRSFGAQSTLTILIQKVLAALPSTASVEWLFSVAGNMQNPGRTRLCPKKSSKLSEI